MIEEKYINNNQLPSSLGVTPCNFHFCTKFIFLYDEDLYFQAYKLLISQLLIMSIVRSFEYSAHALTTVVSIFVLVSLRQTSGFIIVHTVFNRIQFVPIVHIHAIVDFVRKDTS